MQQNSLYKIEAKEFDKAIKLKVWDKVAYSNWRPYLDAKRYVQKLKINGQKEWRKYCLEGKIPKDIPFNPWQTYQEWESLGEFLGTYRIANAGRKYIPYNKAKKILKKLNLKNTKEWKDY